MPSKGTLLFSSQDRRLKFESAVAKLEERIENISSILFQKLFHKYICARCTVVIHFIITTRADYSHRQNNLSSGSSKKCKILFILQITEKGSHVWNYYFTTKRLQQNLSRIVFQANCRWLSKYYNFRFPLRIWSVTKYCFKSTTWESSRGGEIFQHSPKKKEPMREMTRERESCRGIFCLNQLIQVERNYWERTLKADSHLPQQSVFSAVDCVNAEIEKFLSLWGNATVCRRCTRKTP